MIEVLIVDSAESAAARAVSEIATLIRNKPDAVVGVATGATMQPVYRRLAVEVVQGGLDASRVQWFALDEYVGLPKGHPQSYRAEVRRDLEVPLGIPSSHIHVPDGASEGISTAGRRYEEEILSCGGIDLQLLGIGGNGHIGFNEPGSSLESQTRCVALAAETRRDNARFFSDETDVPTHCITQGIATILRARRLLLLATGQTKAVPVARAIEGPISASMPASAVQRHPSATVILDEAAASLLRDPTYRHTDESGLGRVDE